MSWISSVGTGYCFTVIFLYNDVLSVSSVSVFFITLFRLDVKAPERRDFDLFRFVTYSLGTPERTIFSHYYDTVDKTDESPKHEWLRRP